MSSEHSGAEAGSMAALTESRPLPETARGPLIDPAKRYRVDRLREDVYWVADGAYNTIFFTTGEGVICVDAPPTLGPNLLKAIGEITDEPITHLVYSHAHGDHIGAAYLFPAGVTVIAQEETGHILKRMADPKRRLPTETFAERNTLQLGRQRLELYYPGPNHQPGNIFVYAPEQKVLLAIDLVFPGWVPFARLAVSQDIPGFIAAYDRLLDYDFDIFVGGHLTRYGDRSDVETAREYLHDLRANAAEALKSTNFMTIAEQVGFQNRWLLMDRYLGAVAEKCAGTTAQKWSGRLGGVEVFNYSHAWTMMQSLRIDYNFVAG
jgi:glyoxylase-like metal-dependent hydrolase (beta-lactamase superfamily II)